MEAGHTIDMDHDEYVRYQKEINQAALKARVVD